jgi:hypothetical protein
VARSGSVEAHRGLVPSSMACGRRSGGWCWRGMTGGQRRWDEEERLTSEGRPSSGENGRRRSRGVSDLNPSGSVKAIHLTGAGGGSGGLSCEKPKEGGMACGAVSRSA